MGVVIENLSLALIGRELLLFLLWLVLSVVRVRGLSSNQNIRKLYCGRGMRRRWLDVGSRVFGNIFTMDLLQGKEGSRARLLVLAVVFGWCLGSVRGFGQSQDSELTFLLPAGRSECFFQTAVNNGTMEVEYQVTVCGQHRSYNHSLCAHLHVIFWRIQNYPIDGWHLLAVVSVASWHTVNMHILISLHFLSCSCNVKQWQLTVYPCVNLTLWKSTCPVCSLPSVMQCTVTGCLTSSRNSQNLGWNL